MKSTTVVSLTKIAQMLTSRIGRKPLLLTLAATLACLQTAMAASSPRSAKAALRTSPRTHTMGVRRRLPTTSTPGGDNVDVGADGVGRQDDAHNSTSSDRLPGSGDGSTAGVPQLSMEEFREQLKAQLALLKEQKTRLENENKDENADKIQALDNQITAMEKDLHSGRFIDLRGKKWMAFKAIGGVVATGAIAGGAVSVFSDIKNGLKDIKHEGIENGNAKVTVGEKSGYTVTQTTEHADGTVTTTDVNHIYAENVTKSGDTMAQYNATPEGEDANNMFQGNADMPHHLGAIYTFVIMLFCFAFLTYVVFSTYGGKNYQTQGIIVASIGSLGCILGMAGSAALVGDNAPKIANYSELLFQDPSASGVLISAAIVLCGVASLWLLTMLFFRVGRKLVELAKKC